MTTAPNRTANTWQNKHPTAPIAMDVLSTLNNDEEAEGLLEVGLCEEFNCHCINPSTVWMLKSASKVQESEGIVPATLLLLLLLLSLLVLLALPLLLCVPSPLWPMTSAGIHVKVA